MTDKLHALLPCLVFFTAGRTSTGITVLFMQLSLIFWPAARRMARDFDEKSGVQQLLSEFSEKYSVPAEKYGIIEKRFRQAA